MGLMQFLTVGRSLGRISDNPSRYKMTQQNLLPKFGSPKRTNVERGDARQAPAGYERTERTVRLAVVARQKPITLFKKAAEVPAKTGLISRIAGKLKFKKPMQTIEAQISPEAPSGEAKPAFPLGRWTMLPNVSLFRNPFTKAPKQKATTPPVQTEMLLDAIKPVRNDLSDCDLEIVSAGKCASETRPCEPADLVDRPSVELAGAGATVRSSEVAWDRIKTQLFGAGKH